MARRPAASGLPTPARSGRRASATIKSVRRLATSLAVVGALAAQSTAPTLVQFTPRVIAALEDEDIAESSGVAASLANSGIYWTHNDSGDAPVLFAFDRQGRSHGRWTVTGARNVDWEDIALGPGPRGGGAYLYIADIGDNDMARREVTVYRVEEPAVGAAGTCASHCATKAAEAFQMEYPDGPHNAESLIVHPKTGDIYIVSKANAADPATTVYAARANQLGANKIRLAAIARLALPDRLTLALAGGITGGTVSADGRRVALCDNLHYYEATLPGGDGFDQIWKQPFYSRLLGVVGQIEGIDYRADGKALILTGEGKPAAVLEIPLE